MGSCCLCVCVFKIVLGILNSVILMGGLVVAGVGGALIGFSKGSLLLIIQGLIYSVLSTLNLVENSSLSTIEDTDFSQLLQPTGIALVFIGGIIAGIALLGYCGGSITILMKIYALILTVLVLVESVLVAVLFSGSLNPYMQAAANKTLVEHYVNLTDGGIFSMTWNVIMIQVRCCGLTGYTDFFYADHSWPRNETIKLSDGSSHTLLFQTPLACCRTEGNYPTIQFVDDYCAVTPNTNNSNYLTGCWDQVLSELSPYRSTIIFCCSVAIAIQGAVAAMALFIVKDSSKVSPA